MANNHHPTNEMPTGHRPGKEFETLRAAFALQGFGLYRTDQQGDTATYWAECWGLVRHLPTQDDARRYLAQIGGRQ